MSKSEEIKTFVQILEKRFEQHTHRHEGIEWSEVEERLNDGALRKLMEMEETGGEPDVIGRDDAGRIIFCDCSPESPKGRRSTCYDKEALHARKEHKPKTSAMEMAEEMGVEILDEAMYRRLQELGDYDTKTSSWIKTPDDIRERGGAIFADFRYGHVFIYHNGASSYYASRGFRAFFKL